jgi:leader peptidase (prepilin peptidase)/N-methyltransferase
MGEGDVRLAALLGVFLGWIGPMHVPVGLFLGFVAGALAGVGVMVLGRSRSGRKTAIPFGPFMALGAVIVIWWGQPLIRLWLGD